MGTIEKHKALLGEKGYLEGNFGTPAFLDRWFQEFTAEWQLKEFEAHTLGKQQRFTLEMRGRFDHDMDMVHFSFRFQYQPDHQLLRIRSVSARMDKERKTILFHRSEDLPFAQAVYDILAKKRSERLQRTAGIRQKLPMKGKRTIIITEPSKRKTWKRSY